MDSHESNRKKVCILCLSNNKNVRPISTAVKEVIRQYHLPDIANRQWYYPSSICTSCRVKCNTNNGSKSEILHMYKYKYDSTQLTRSTGTCNCEICRAAKVVIGKNLPGVVPKKVKPGRPRKKVSDVAKVVRICNVCLSEIKRGKKHGCNSSERTENLSKILKAKNSPSKSAEAAVSDFLTEKASSSGIDINLYVLYINNNKNFISLGGNLIRLSNRRGKPSLYQKTSLASASSNKAKMCSDDLFKIKTENSLSMRKTLGNVLCTIVK